MLSALQLIFSGGIFIPPEILIRDEEPPPRIAAKQSGAARPNILPADIGLTKRQLEVLALMTQGKSNKVISRTLDMAEATVKTHVTAILKSLKVSNRVEAVIAVGQLGWALLGVGKL